MDNQNENNINDNSQQEPELSQEQIQKNQEAEASKKIGKTVVRGAAAYFTAGESEKLKNIPGVGKVVDKGLDVAGSAVGKISNIASAGQTGRSAKKLDDLGLIDGVNKTADAIGGSFNSPNSNFAKNNMRKQNVPKNSSNAIPDRRMPINPNQNVAKQNQSDEELKNEISNGVEDIKNKAENNEMPTNNNNKEVSGDFKLNISLKSFGIIGLAVLIFVFIYFIYALISRMDLVGKKYTDYDELDYVANSSSYCTDITLVKETDSYTGPTVTNIDDVNLDETVKINNQVINRWETTSYKLEDYVKGVLQAEAIDVGDDKTFEVASIVARTYALQIASENCRIWDNTNKNTEYRNPQNFTTDSPDGKISSSVGLTSGVVIMDKDNLLDLSQDNYYDYMCFEKIHEEDDNNKNYEIIQDIIDGRLLPTEWVLENVNINNYNKSGKYDEQCQKNGLSLYSAKYLMNTKADKYTPIRVLKYFYGYDKDLQKIMTQSPFGVCGDFNLNETSLTKEQFIALVNSYNGGSKYSNLAAIAGQIYDLSVSNNFNPELVITRAIVEGYSGGANNYWGINACNNCKGGSGYGSLANGALAFINTMKKYNAATLYDVYNKYHYAYIGSNWIKGSTSKGGCYYLEHIAKYYTDQNRLQEARNACASGNAIATNDEDQSAYSHWQVSKMNDVRSKIFGISPENCDELENPINVNAAEILNSDASIGQKAAQLAIALFDHFGYDQDRRDFDGYVDCSSLVYRTYQQLGINISYNGINSTDGIYNWAKAQNRFITQDQLQPGDLVWRKGHVEIYIGNGQTFGAHGKEDKYANNKEAQVSVTNMGEYTHFIRPY